MLNHISIHIFNHILISFKVFIQHILVDLQDMIIHLCSYKSQKPFIFKTTHDSNFNISYLWSQKLQKQGVTQGKPLQRYRHMHSFSMLKVKIQVQIKSHQWRIPLALSQVQIFNFIHYYRDQETLGVKHLGHRDKVPQIPQLTLIWSKFST